MNQNKLTDTTTKSKSALQRQSLIDRLKLKELEQSKFVIIIAAAAFIIHWLANVVASLMIMHFQPETLLSGVTNQSETVELGLLISILLTSLFTFIIAIVSFIELLKFSQAGCTIAVILAWTNFFISVLLLIYTHYWLGACVQLIFALSMTFLLIGKTTILKFTFGFLFLILNFVTVLYPSTQYMQAQNLMLTNMADIDEFRPNSNQKINNLDEIVRNTGFLMQLAPYFGEKEKNIALITSYYALSKAYNGDAKEGYKFARKSVKQKYIKLCFQNKVKIYALLNNIEYIDYEPIVLKPEEEELYEKKMSLLKYSEDIGISGEDDLSDLDNIDDN